jgi:hypothetical protein
MKALLAIALVLLGAAPALAQSPASFTRSITVMSSQTINRGTSGCTSLRPCTDTDWIDVRGVSKIGVSITATSASGTAQVTALPIISTAATRPTGQEGVSRPTLTVSDSTELEQYLELAADQAWSWMKVRVLGLFSSPADTEVTMQLTFVPR